jgi:secretion/DNA translocation related TadE-like protein
VSSRESGNVTVLVTAAIVVAVLLGTAVARLGSAVAEKSRANNAADAAALAAAGELASGRTPATACATARRTAADNGARLLTCQWGDSAAVVTVVMGEARAIARAEVDAAGVISGDHGAHTVRSIALLVGVAAVFVVAAPPVAAAPAAPGTATSTSSVPSGTGVPSDAIGLVLAQVAGSGLAVTLDPGGSEEHDLVVSNHTANLRLTVKLTATDATGNLGTAAASWLSFGDDSVQLDPHAATTVPMTVAVPHDTQPASALAHVTATVESAVAAADGSPVGGTATETFPVSISVRGTPTAQIAIADVHRDDQGSRHLLAIVLRNFGAQGARVSGHVRVAGDHPQTLPFAADLAASRDTTVKLPWGAPPVGTPSDIAVDLEYGTGNVASWSSRLGGAPTDLSAQSGAPVSTATTAPVTSVTAPAPTTSDR